MFTRAPLKFIKRIAALAQGEGGQAMVEYGLILALVSLVAIGLTPIGQTLAQIINNMAVAI